MLYHWKITLLHKLTLTLQHRQFDLQLTVATTDFLGHAKKLLLHERCSYTYMHNCYKSETCDSNITTNNTII